MMVQGMAGEMRRATRYGREGRTSSFQCFIMMHRFMLGFVGALRFVDVERQERQEPEGKEGVCVCRLLVNDWRFLRCELERPARGAYSGNAPWEICV